ncbi:hypothetical protein Sm713_32350 [Streptomyces sp. TS71-3]|nr:hypothetical protein Sm713_32350 [Streptomyces sp. TS71-3]
MHSAIVRAGKPATATVGAAAHESEPAGSRCGVDACRTPAETSADPALTVADAEAASGCGRQG